jgi:hypothetical protein
MAKKPVGCIPMYIGIAQAEAAGSQIPVKPSSLTADKKQD